MTILEIRLFLNSLLEFIVPSLSMSTASVARRDRASWNNLTTLNLIRGGCGKSLWAFTQCLVTKLSHSKFLAPSICSFDRSARVQLVSPTYFSITGWLVSSHSHSSHSMHTASYTTLFILHLEGFFSDCVNSQAGQPIQ